MCKTIIAFVIIVLLDVSLVVIFGPYTVNGFFNIMIYSGLVLVVASIFLLGKRNLVLRSDSNFLKVRVYQRPFEETILSITTASAVVFSIGQLLAIILY